APRARAALVGHRSGCSARWCADQLEALGRRQSRHLEADPWLPLRLPNATCRLLAAEDLVDDAVRPAARVHPGLHLLWIVDRLDPIVEGDGRLGRISEIGLEEMIQRAGIGLADVPVAQRELAGRLGDGHALAGVQI